MASGMPESYRGHVLSAHKHNQAQSTDTDGRGTPLPRYEKSASVPFTLTLQEERDAPGQFQLVVNVDPSYQKPLDGNHLEPSPSKKLIANLKEASSLGYDASNLYQTQKSSTPPSPSEELQTWSEIDAITPEFLEKVVPDWKVTFSRSDSTSSISSRKLADIKARIKKSGKGFVVRLLKGSSTDANEVAEIHLGQGSPDAQPKHQELDSQPRAELDASDTSLSLRTEHSLPSNIFEIGTSGEVGVQRAAATQVISPIPSVPEWTRQRICDQSRRASTLEEGFSDAETLAPEARSIAERIEDHVVYNSSNNHPILPIRADSVSSIIRTPTRGLSVVGPVKRNQKLGRPRNKGKGARRELNRSGAQRSIKYQSPLSSFYKTGMENIWVHTSSTTDSAKDDMLPVDGQFDSDNNWQDLTGPENNSHQRSVSLSIKNSEQRAKTKTRLRLHTDVPQQKSADTSPLSRKRRSPRTQKQTSDSSADEFVPARRNRKPQVNKSPVWSEVVPPEELRQALNRAALGREVTDEDEAVTSELQSIFGIQEPVSEQSVGQIHMPHEYEIKPPTPAKNRLATFCGLAFSSVVENAIKGLDMLKDRYGNEPPVPQNHIRVRWTCVSTTCELI
jgi:hypothetical protein